MQDEHPAEREQPRPEPPPAQCPPGQLAHTVTLLLLLLSRLPLPLPLPPVLRLPHAAVAVCGLRAGPAAARSPAAGAARALPAPRTGLRHRFGPRVRCHVQPSSSATGNPQPAPEVPSAGEPPGPAPVRPGPGTRRARRG
ncbi:hypothetical protein AVW11_16315 [Streptomyces amritsarensis]|uniref:Uncharacterized protein n=1 Tax=Streptomyces amritsarensis TaxID=681158 RepID=A0ABX3G6A2_9ACTN|nr:hypothetical protein AVW11_16315 [Streptomyces amritsarensis]